MDSAGYTVDGFPISHREAEKLLDRVITPIGLSLKVYIDMETELMFLNNLYRHSGR